MVGTDTEGTQAPLYAAGQDGINMHHRHACAVPGMYHDSLGVPTRICQVPPSVERKPPLPLFVYVYGVYLHKEHTLRQRSRFRTPWRSTYHNSIPYVNETISGAIMTV